MPCCLAFPLYSEKVLSHRWQRGASSLRNLCLLFWCWGRSHDTLVLLMTCYVSSGWLSSFSRPYFPFSVRQDYWYLSLHDLPGCCEIQSKRVWGSLEQCVMFVSSIVEFIYWVVSQVMWLWNQLCSTVEKMTKVCAVNQIKFSRRLELWMKITILNAICRKRRLWLPYKKAKKETMYSKVPPCASSREPFLTNQELDWMSPYVISH